MRSCGRPASRWLLLAAFPIGLLLLQGCIGVETTIRFAADGSGTAELSYRVSQFVTRLGTAEGERGAVPLPITGEDFRQAVSEVPGVTLRGDVRQTEDEEDVHLEASLGFDRIESLVAVRGFQSMASTLEREADGWTYRQVLTEGVGEGSPIDTETLSMVRALFADYALTFVIEAPAPVRSASLGTVSGSTVTYRVAVADLLEARERMVLEVAW